MEKVCARPAHRDFEARGHFKLTSPLTQGQESAEALSEELWKDDFDVWETVYKTNVVGAHFCAVRALPLLRKSTLTEPGFSSSIINITSISGITKMSQHHLPYK